MDQRIQKVRHQVSFHLCTRTSQEAIEKALTWIALHRGCPARRLNKIFKASLSPSNTEATDNDIGFPRSVTLSSITTSLKDIPILDVDGQEDMLVSS